jgi:hypothetical protein
MFSALLFPLLLAAVFFLAMAKLVLFRTHYDLPKVILFVRKLDMAEFAKLLDPEEEWILRNLCSDKEFRKVQRERMRLAIEYLRRVGHNAEVIQAWTTTLYQQIKSKPKAEFSEQDYLVCELVKLSTELRVCNAAALMKATFCLLFLSHLWPLKFIPRVTDLRRSGQVDMVGKYRTLVEISTSLSRTYGQKYYEELMSAF